MKSIILLLMASSLQLYGQSKLGMLVPEVEFSTMINSEKTKGTLSDFRPKILILDFWATWCAPCIESFPHLEALQNKFRNDITIVTVTNEPEERIRTFLQKRNTSLPIILDGDGQLTSTFPHRSLPHTVVIDKNGIVRTMTTPKELTEERMRNLIAGEQIQLAEKIDNLDFDPSKPLSANENFTYQITVTPYQNGLPSMSNSTGGSGAYKDRRILCTNLSPKSLYEIAYQFPAGIRTVLEVKDRAPLGWSKETALCFDLIVPADIGEKRFEIMQQHLRYLYTFKPTIEKRQTKVKVLKPIAGQTIAIKPAAGGQREIRYSGQGLSMKNAEIAAIVEFLESQLDVPVVDETNATGLFDVELNWYNENPDHIYDALRNVGLELVDTERAIEVLVIYDKDN